MPSSNDVIVGSNSSASADYFSFLAIVLLLLVDFSAKFFVAEFGGKGHSLAGKVKVDTRPIVLRFFPVQLFIWVQKLVFCNAWALSLLMANSL